MKVANYISQLKPYQPGRGIDEISREYGLAEVYKLASNENALGVSPRVVAALSKAIANINRYPDADCYELRQKAAEKWGMGEKQIAFGNGSNEVIDLLIRIFCQSGDKVLTSKAAFIAYKVCAQAAGIGCDEVAMTKAFKLDVKSLMANWREEHKVVFIANPNNPTGTYIDKNDLEELIGFFATKNCVLVVDEAYTEFVRAPDYVSALSYLDHYDNLLLLRTFSKVGGIAGLRIGALLGSEEVVALYNRVRNPFNVNSLAQVAAIAALEDTSYISQSQQLVWQGLDYFYSQLNRISCDYIPSQANFVLFHCQGQDGAVVGEKLLRKGVIMRPMQAYGLDAYLRLSVGNQMENEVAMQALAEVL